MILQVVRTFTEELVGRFRPMIVRLAASITRDEFQAEDIAQEVLLILNRKQDILCDLSSSRTRNYIYTVTRNYAVKSVQRKTKEDVTYCDPADLNNIEGEPDIHAFTDEHGFSDEIAALLARLWSSLGRVASEMVFHILGFNLRCRFMLPDILKCRV